MNTIGTFVFLVFTLLVTMAVMADCITYPDYYSDYELVSRQKTDDTSDQKSTGLRPKSSREINQQIEPLPHEDDLYIPQQSPVAETYSTQIMPMSTLLIPLANSMHTSVVKPHNHKITYNTDRPIKSSSNPLQEIMDM